MLSHSEFSSVPIEGQVELAETSLSALATPQSTPRLPTTVKAVCLWYWASALIGGGLALLSPINGLVSDRNSGDFVFSLMGLTLALVYFCLGLGLWKRNQTAHRLAVLWSGGQLLFILVAFPAFLLSFMAGPKPSPITALLASIVIVMPPALHLLSVYGLCHGAAQNLFLALSAKYQGSAGIRAPAALRLVNYWIDIGFNLVIFFGYAYLGGGLDGTTGWLFRVGCILAYYIFFESVFQKTPGKFLTGTQVVGWDGHRPNFGTVILRSLIRLIPFNAVSARNGDWWHDCWAKTHVVLEVKS